MAVFQFIAGWSLSGEDVVAGDDCIGDLLLDIVAVLTQGLHSEAAVVVLDLGVVLDRKNVNFAHLLDLDAVVVGEDFKSLKPIGVLATRSKGQTSEGDACFHAYDLLPRISLYSA
jgi:hypothetical protein